MKNLGKNPFTLNFIETFSDDEFFYIVTTFDGQKNLEEYLLQKKNLSVISFKKINWKINEKRKLIYKCAQCIKFCHSKSIIHKDIKLSNFVINFSNKICLIDFGFAQIKSSKSNEGFIGTPYYASPEMILNNSTISKF